MKTNVFDATLTRIGFCPNPCAPFICRKALEFCSSLKNLTKPKPLKRKNTKYAIKIRLVY